MKKLSAILIIILTLMSTSCTNPIITGSCSEVVSVMSTVAQSICTVVSLQSRNLSYNKSQTDSLQNELLLSFVQSAQRTISHTNLKFKSSIQGSDAFAVSQFRSAELDSLERTLQLKLSLQSIIK